MLGDVLSAVFTSPVSTYSLSNTGTDWYAWNPNYGVLFDSVSGATSETVPGFSNRTPFSWDSTQIDNMNLEWNYNVGMIEIQQTASGGVIWFYVDGSNLYSDGGQFLAVGSVSSVPDTAPTFLLLGLGLAGLALASRKMVAAA
jgi:hypothetical protein